MNQRGAALLGTLLAALTLALGWVLSQQSLTSGLLQRNAALQRHWRTEAQADVWLVRAQRLPWPAHSGWQCRTLAAGWQACLHVSTSRQGLLCLSGQPPLLGYSVVRVLFLQGEHHGQSLALRAQAGGWIDYLPPGVHCPAAGQ